MPYPPGIPMLMSGENFGDDDGPQIGYMRGLAAWDRQFPGFEHVTEGAEAVDGTYHVLCVRSAAKSSKRSAGSGARETRKGKSRIEHRMSRRWGHLLWLETSMDLMKPFPIAIIDEDCEGKRAAGRGMQQLAAAIEKEGCRVVTGTELRR